MWVMNNDTHLFIGIYLYDKKYVSTLHGDFYLYTDTNFDGDLDLDDLKILEIESKGYSDCWVDLEADIGYIYLDSTQNGYITYKHSNPIDGEWGNYFFEIALPFNTTLSDPSELNLTRGNSIILQIKSMLSLGGRSGYFIEWPYDSTQFQVSTFGNITLGWLKGI